MKRLSKALQKLADSYASAQCGQSNFVAEYAPGAVYAVREGFIRVEENLSVPSSLLFGYVHIPAKEFVIGIKVGGRIPDEVHKAIAEKVKSLVGNLGTYDSRTGTAWSFYGLLKGEQSA